MSLNTAHANGGVLIHSGEYILIFTDNVTMEFSGQSGPAFDGSKQGRMYLTTHRMIFNHKDNRDMMQSFSFPFITLSDVELEQPIFGANYIKGKVRAQPNGNWTGEAKFKIYFKSGGAIEFGQAMLRAAQMAQQNFHSDAPPPYQAPQDPWYAAPPPAYAPPPAGFYGFVPPTHVFPQQPPQDGVFMTNSPPPYPGIYVPNDNGFNGAGYNQNPPSYNQAAGYPSYPPNPSYPQNPGYPMQGPGGYPQQNPGGYMPQAPSYSHQNPGYPAQNPGGYPQQQQGGYPGYPPQGGFTAGGTNQSQDAKAAEAAQSAYYDPNRPQMAYVPPPAYYENPPTYNDPSNKKND